MMKTIFHALCVTLILCSVALAAKSRRTEIRPKEPAERVAIERGGKVRSYFALSSRHPATLLVKGPAAVRVLTRAQIAEGTSDGPAYHVMYRVDGGEAGSLEADDVEPAPDARYVELHRGVPGDSRDFTVRVGRGYHSIEFMLRDSLPQVAARYLVEGRKEKKVKWIALSPLAPCEPVDLLAGEETTHYYRFSSRKPLKVEIIGPTLLRILTRVENSYDMKGRASYRLQIRQNGEVLQSFLLSSKRSETTKYKKDSKLVPGKAREVVFHVPKGKQTYEITFLDKGTLLGQIMFPRKDVKLGL